MMAPTPSLTAIISVGNQREQDALALESLLTQSIVDQMEVLLFDCSAPGTPPLRGSEHPNVRVIFAGNGCDAGWIRAEGVRQASAPIVVFLEEHARAMSGWGEAILNALQGEWAGVGAEFHNANADRGFSRFIALTYYPQWLAPATYEASARIPIHNSAYKRDTLLSYGEQLESLLFPEVLLQWKLLSDNHTLLLDPAMKVLHYFETDLPTVSRGDFLSSRAFSSRRSQHFDWPVGARIVRVLIAPLMPFVRTAKLGWYLIRHRREKLPTYLQGLPVIFASHAAAATGEVAGILFGYGNTGIHYQDYQINARREGTAAKS